MAKAAVEKIRNMTTDDMRGITLFFSKEWRGVQPLVLVWAHLLRLYLTCCSFRYGTSSARFSIGFPADILQETAVHQSRGIWKGEEEGKTIEMYKRTMFCTLKDQCQRHHTRTLCCPTHTMPDTRPLHKGRTTGQNIFATDQKKKKKGSFVK